MAAIEPQHLMPTVGKILEDLSQILPHHAPPAKEGGPVQLVRPFSDLIKKLEPARALKRIAVAIENDLGLALLNYILAHGQEYAELLARVEALENTPMFHVIAAENLDDPQVFDQYMAVVEEMSSLCLALVDPDDERTAQFQWAQKLTGRIRISVSFDMDEESEEEDEESEEESEEESDAGGGPDPDEVGQAPKEGEQEQATAATPDASSADADA